MIQHAAAHRFIRLEADGRVAIITMQRSDRRNALSLELMLELTQAVRAVGDDSSFDTLIMRAEGPAFSAGHDLRELLDRDAAQYAEIFDACVELMGTIQRIPQPVIAQVSGVATAAGCQLVASCDLAVASSDARFATPGVRIGLFCTTPMVALTRAVGRKRAMEMLLTGDFIDARTAADWGLINRVVEPDRIDEETLALARKIGEASRSIVGLGKTAFYQQIELPQPAAYTYAKDVMTQNALHADAQEGMSAFVDKRKPRWQNGS